MHTSHGHSGAGGADSNTHTRHPADADAHAHAHPDARHARHTRHTHAVGGVPHRDGRRRRDDTWQVCALLLLLLLRRRRGLHGTCASGGSWCNRRDDTSSAVGEQELDVLGLWQVVVGLEGGHKRGEERVVERVQGQGVVLHALGHGVIHVQLQCVAQGALWHVGDVT